VRIHLNFPAEVMMMITRSQKPTWSSRRHAFRRWFSAGSFVVACLLCTSAWGASVVYVAPSGNDQNNGATAATAVKSVARGLALAAAGTQVQIAAGVYDEQLPPIPQGVILSGGWDSSFTDAKRTTLTPQSLRTLKPGSDKCTSYTCLTNSKGDRVVTLRSPGGQQLEQLVVLGPDLSSRTDGSSSFGVVVDGASGVRLNYMSIEAGTGATGMAGENKLPPTGTCTRGGIGGGGGVASGQGNHFAASCSDQPAQAGGSVTVNGAVVAKGGDGGPSGHTSCGGVGNVHTSNLSNGQNGGNGQNGIQGPAGAAVPTDPGYFTYTPAGDLFWIGSPGGRGSDGSHGAGGGGGAAGDTDNVYFYCTVSQPILGGAGRDGGDGGCGGGGGGGGDSGGGAFALVVADTTVGSAGLVLFGGSGGQGGQGGASAAGTPGVKDDTPGSGGQSTGKQCCCVSAFGGCGCAFAAGPIIAGTGGAGGHGGDGGGGGGGAGGNGGPSIQLVSLANGALSMDANASVRYAGGRSGTGGTGGKGAQDNNTGPAGNGGTTATQLAVPLQYIAATASNSSSDAPPAQAVDGNPNTAWNAGGGTPAWIELDLKQTVTLAKVNLLVGQSPAGPTTHQLYFGASPAPTAQIATEQIATTDGQWLIVDLSTQKPTGRYLRVLTTASPSWVAWREIVVQTQ
jgi:hypothetical protein